MDFWKGYMRACWTVAIPLLLLVPLSTVLFLADHERVAYAVSYAGTGFVLVGNLVYILVLEARKRGNL